MLMFHRFLSIHQNHNWQSVKIWFIQTPSICCKRSNCLHRAWITSESSERDKILLECIKSINSLQRFSLSFQLYHIRAGQSKGVRLFCQRFQSVACCTRLLYKLHNSFPMDDDGYNYRARLFVIMEKCEVFGNSRWMQLGVWFIAAHWWNESNGKFRDIKAEYSCVCHAWNEIVTISW